MKIYCYDLDLYRKPTKHRFSRDQFVKREETIAAQNERYMILNNCVFTKISITGNDYGYPTLNKPSIAFKDCLGEQGAFYTLYSTKPVKTSTIENQIRKAASKEYGYLFDGELDLSILNKSEGK